MGVVIWRDRGLTGKAWADTEDDVREFRATMKAKGLHATARRKYETFLGERFVKTGSVIKLSWEPCK